MTCLLQSAVDVRTAVCTVDFMTRCAPSLNILLLTFVTCISYPGATEDTPNLLSP